MREIQALQSEFVYNRVKMHLNELTLRQSLAVLLIQLEFGPGEMREKRRLELFLLEFLWNLQGDLYSLLD